jgi:hypothetical protein
MNGDHKRNTGPMLLSLRCGAKTRSGRPCRSPSVHGKKRCRMHGGAAGSGAPRGNKNALKHGRYTREAIAERGRTRELVQQSRRLLLQIKQTLSPAAMPVLLAAVPGCRIATRLWPFRVGRALVVTDNPFLPTSGIASQIE